MLASLLVALLTTLLATLLAASGRPFGITCGVTLGGELGSNIGSIAVGRLLIGCNPARNKLIIGGTGTRGSLSQPRMHIEPEPHARNAAPASGLDVYEIVVNALHTLTNIFGAREQ